MPTLDISTYKPVANTLEDAVQVANGLQAIQNVVNGLDSANWGAGQIFPPSKLTQEGGTTAMALIWDGSKWAPATVKNAQVDAAAAIVYSKLSLAGSLKRSDMATLLNGPPGTQVDYTEVTSSPTSVATTAAGATAVITGGAFTYDGTTPVWVEFYCPAVHNSGAGNTVTFDLWDSVSGDLGKLWSTNVNASNDNGVMAARKLTPTAAAHTYSIRMWVSAGTGTMDCGVGGAGVFLPAFLRIRVA
jgi:hypothetical protein